jgi:Sulfotransferase domain
MTASAKAPAAPARDTRAPDFYIVGHAKSGTTALYEMLRRHPQVFMPDMKEPWFFASDLRVALPPSNPLPATLADYLTLFSTARPDQRTGEATPSYLVSREAARNIAELRPDARIIAILREPVSFLRSLHMQSVKNHAETETDLRKALALEGPRREGREIPAKAVRPRELFYSEHVRYVEQLRRYHAEFSSEQVLVLTYEDFRADNQAGLRQVLQFLDVDDSCSIAPIEANKTVRVRSPRLYELLRALAIGRGPLSGPAKSAIKAVTPQRLRRDAQHAIRRRILYGKPHAPDEDLTLELRRQMKGEVVALSEYLGRDFVSRWGYDDVR